MSGQQDLFAERRALGVRDGLDYHMESGVLLSLMRAFGPGITVGVLAGMRRSDVMTVQGIGPKRLRGVELALHDAGRRFQAEPALGDRDRADTAFDWEIPRDAAPVHESLSGLAGAIQDSGVDMDVCRLEAALSEPWDEPEETPGRLRAHPFPPHRQELARAIKIIERAGYRIVREAS